MSNPSKPKRKQRSTGSENSNTSPEGKKQRNVSEDEVFQALEMADCMASRLEEITKKLDKLGSIENKLDEVVDSLKVVEKKISKLDTEVVRLNTKYNEIKDTLSEMDDGMKHLNKDVEDIKEWKGQASADIAYLRAVKADQFEISKIKTKIDYMEAYSRRENLKFVGIPETDREDTKEVLLDFLEREMEIKDVREIEFQRVHRQAKGKEGQPRTIIARFLRYTDVEHVLRSTRNLRNTRYVVYQDFPKAILEERKRQMGAMKEAKRSGKKAFFSRTEPDKLFIDGRLHIP